METVSILPGWNALLSARLVGIALRSFHDIFVTTPVH